MAAPETFRTLYFDPGEDFGWCVGQYTKLLAAGTDKMMVVPDALWAILQDPSDPSNIFNEDGARREGVEPCFEPVCRVVCEDFRIYPWKAKDLKFDKVRTARVIGAVAWICHHWNVPFVLQGANIKKAAQAAGAEELYYRPLTENRHQNDAIQHFVFYTNVELLQLPFPKPEGYTGEEDYH